MDAVISPDGNQLAYSDRANGLSLLQIDTGKVLSFPNSRNVVPNDWFPDGTHLLVNGSWRMSTVDGTGRQIIDDDGYGGSVSRDGSRITFRRASNDSELWVIGADSVDAHRILSVEPSKIHLITWSPTSRRIVYLRTNVTGEPTLESCDSDGQQRIPILSDSRLIGFHGTRTGLSWLRDGRVLYRFAEEAPNEKYDNVWSIDVDPDTGQVRGHPGPITTGIGFTQSSFSASVDGKRFVFFRIRTQDTAWLAQLQRGSGEWVTSRSLSEEGWDKWPTGWTRDSQAIVFYSNPQGKPGLFKQEVRTNATQPLLSGSDRYWYPEFSPDGRWLLFAQSAHDALTGSIPLMRVPVNGGPATVVLTVARNPSFQLFAGNFLFQCAWQANLCVLSDVSKDKRSFSLLDPVTGRGAELLPLQVQHHVDRMDTLQ